MCVRVCVRVCASASVRASERVCVCECASVSVCVSAVCAAAARLLLPPHPQLDPSCKANREKDEGESGESQQILRV